MVFTILRIPFTCTIFSSIFLLGLVIIIAGVILLVIGLAAQAEQ